jgi:hypothetical protein
MLRLAADENFNNNYERVGAHKPMPGVFEVSRAVPVSTAIEGVLLITECSLEGEWEGDVRYLPLA